MNYIAFGKTDIGLEKEQNQDSFLLKRANTSLGEIAFAVLCDGMGGLEQGEVASSTVIKAFNSWFETMLPNLLKFGLSGKILNQQWSNMIKNLNVQIGNYGVSQNIELGTTVCAILLVNDKYYCINVGDSRAYKISDERIIQITKDQSLVQRKIDQGLITEEQANIDSDRSVLLQCIGGSPEVEPDYYEGTSVTNETYMLCSDGFRHEISSHEIHQMLAPSVITNIEQMEINTKHLIDLNMQREETDNITTILVRTY